MLVHRYHMVLVIFLLAVFAVTLAEGHPYGYSVPVATSSQQLHLPLINNLPSIVRPSTSSDYFAFTIPHQTLSFLLSWDVFWMSFLGVFLLVLLFVLPQSSNERESVLIEPVVVTQSPQTPQPQTEEFVVRLFQPEDYRLGYLALLRQSFAVPEVEEEVFMQRSREIAALNNRINLVIEHAGRIVASGTLTIERRRLLRSSSVLGHLDEIIVDRSYRRQGLGRLLLQHLQQEASRRGCARVSLDCDPRNVEFYTRAGFEADAVFMTQRLAR